MSKLGSQNGGDEAISSEESPGQAELTATLKRTLSESEDRILLRQTNSGSSSKLSVHPYSPKVKNPVSVSPEGRDDDTNSETTTTSDVDSEDDSSSIVSRISRIVVEQEGKLLSCSPDGEPKSLSPHHHDRFRRPLTDSNGSLRADHGNMRKKSLTMNAASNNAPRPIAELQVLTTEQQNLPQIHIHNYEKDDKGAANEFKKSNSNDSSGNSSSDSSNNSNRVRAKSVAGEGPNQAQKGMIRRNESSGYLPERGDLRDLEVNRKLSHYASFSKTCPSNNNSTTTTNNGTVLIRHRSNTAGSSDQAAMMDSLTAGGGNQPMLNIRRSTWTLNEFDQAFNKSSNKSQTSSISDADPIGATDHCTTDTVMSASSLGVFSSQSASGTLPPQTMSVAGSGSKFCLNPHHPDNKQQQQPPPPTTTTTNNLLIQASKRAVNFGAQQQQLQGGSQSPAARYANTLEVARFISSSPGIRMEMDTDRRLSEVSYALSCDSYCIRPTFLSRQGKGFGAVRRRWRRGSQATGSGGADDDPEEERAGCLRSCLNLDTLGQYLPILQWLPGYSRGLLWGDLMAGLAVAVLNISTSLSAAVVAETDLGAAFRASIVNTFVYAILCSSRHTSFGSWSIMSQMLIISVRRALSDELLLSRLNIGPTALWDTDEYERWHLNIIIMYTFLIGLTQLIGGFLNLGNILASFIPEALCSSMIAATAFTMAVGQLANMCGTSNKILWSIEKNTTELWADLKNPPVDITDLFAGLFRWIQQIALLAKYHEQVNFVCVIISVISVISLFLNQYVIQTQLEKLFKKKIFIPFEMILLIVMIALSRLLEWEESYNVPTCGPIKMDFDIPTLPNLKLIRELWFESLTTAIISYSMVYVMAKTYSNKLNYEVDCNQELIACGAGNLIGGLFDALPATASFSRTAGQVEAGGNTQMASIINCIVLISLVKLLGHHVAALPLCVMSATLFFGFVRMMTRFTEVFSYWRVCKVDFAIWLVTFVSILTLDLINGFIYGFIFSILTMLYRAQNRRCYMLGCIGSADVYVPLEKYQLAQEIDGIKIFQFCGPIHYVCADLFEKLLRRRTRVDVKAIAKHMAEREIVKFNPRDMNLPSHIILDFSMISFIDSAGVKTIRKIIEDYDKVNVTVLLASLASHVAAVVKTEPSLWETYKDRFYITVADAVHCAIRDTQQPPENSRKWFN